MEPIFVKPSFREKIWGGSKLKDDFGFDIPSDHTGEAWLISAHPSGDSWISYPEEVKGQTLRAFYQDNEAFFGPDQPEKFPLLIKILDASDWLSVQVHPDDAYAAEHENDLGKTECWYVLSADEGAEIIYGHNAKTREEFAQMIEAGQWDKLLRRKKVKAGEFYYVPYGTIHALGKGITVLETQQSSDTTYRVYDFDRKDKDGNLRELHLQKSIDVTQVPHKDPEFRPIYKRSDGGFEEQLVADRNFTVYKWQVDGSLTVQTPDTYHLATVIEGEGELTASGKTYPLKKGTSFILPYSTDEVSLTGQMTLIASRPEKPED